MARNLLLEEKKMEEVGGQEVVDLEEVEGVVEEGALLQEEWEGEQGRQLHNPSQKALEEVEEQESQEQEGMLVARGVEGR